MNPRIFAATVLFATLFGGVAWADSDCGAVPVADWQPREVLWKQLEQQGWTVQRIKVDDGCYEVRGTDRLGNRFKAKYVPDSLRIRKLEIDFNQSGDASDYLDQGSKARRRFQHGQ